MVECTSPPPRPDPAAIDPRPVADEVRRAVTELNRALRNAAILGLRVRLRKVDLTSLGDRFHTIEYDVTIEKRERI